ncbi:MAG: M15 family metallopeptidase [Micrococcales bacterium]|nr:M15 family metallopeptidase [Micrococcales bacterium]MCL2666490.1 M15 family metallopeptidase [Micrococcales bacterium]
MPAQLAQRFGELVAGFSGLVAGPVAGFTGWVATHRGPADRISAQLVSHRLDIARATVVVAMVWAIAASSVGLVTGEKQAVVAQVQAQVEQEWTAEVAAAREAAAASAQVAIDKAEAVRASAAEASVPPETLASLDEASAQVQQLVDQVRDAPVTIDPESDAPPAVRSAAPNVPETPGVVDLPVTTPQTHPDPAADAAVILDVVTTPMDEAKETLPEVTMSDDALTELLAAVDQLAESTAEVTAAAEANRVASELDGAYAQAIADAQAAHEAALAAAAQTRAARLSADARSLDGYSNGQIPVSALCSPAFNLSARLRCDAAEMLDGLNQAYRAQFGHDLIISDSYRTLAGQVTCRQTKGSLCATPGTSRHGLGLAVDLSGPPARLGTTEHQWMLNHVGEYGWLKPAWSLPTGGNPEPWHFEFTGAP